MNAPNIGLIILAAGNSSRLGSPKQTVLFRGETLLGRIFKEASESLCRPIIVVLGNKPDVLSKTINSLQAYTVINENWEQGMGTSISLGVKELVKLNEKIDGAVLCVCDQPFVTYQVINQLVDSFYEKGVEIVASSYENTIGVPALFSKKLFPELMALGGKSGAKNIIEKYSEESYYIEFPEGAIDIDTIEDVKKLQSLE